MWVLQGYGFYLGGEWGKRLKAGAQRQPTGDHRGICSGLNCPWSRIKTHDRPPLFVFNSWTILFPFTLKLKQQISAALDCSSLSLPPPDICFPSAGVIIRREKKHWTAPLHVFAPNPLSPLGLLEVFFFYTYMKTLKTLIKWHAIGLHLRKLIYAA